VLGSGLVPLLGLLLFQHHVTGLARPDALYLVYGSEVYAGLGAILSPRLATGIVNALFAARDGLLVMAPVLIAAALALPISWRQSRRPTLALTAVFAAVWFVAAVHEGGAPGPPARLMAPAIPLLSVPVAIALRTLRPGVAYR
jgi:urea transporter